MVKKEKVKNEKVKKNSETFSCDNFFQETFGNRKLCNEHRNGSKMETKALRKLPPPDGPPNFENPFERKQQIATNRKFIQFEMSLTIKRVCVYTGTEPPPLLYYTN